MPFRKSCFRDMWTAPVGGSFQETLLVGKVIKRFWGKIASPSYEEIKIYFQKNRNKFRFPEMLRFRQIVCKSKKEAAKLRHRIRAGEDMGELARKYSTAPESEAHG